jgi:hypothetical protein
MAKLIYFAGSSPAVLQRQPSLRARWVFSDFPGGLKL